MTSFIDALLLTGLFAGTAVLALAYYRLTLPAAELHRRLPNRLTWASVLLTVLMGLWIWYVWQTSGGFTRWRQIIGMLFNLLIFETFFVLFLRWIRSNVLAVVVGGTLVAGMIWLQTNIGIVWIYNVTFILATFGATTLLIRLGYLRTKILALVGGLWMMFDILSVLYVYPKIYHVTDRPHTSFFYPAVASGQVTLGSGDFMFLVLMTLVLFRDRDKSAAWLHIALQSAALLITILVKSRDSLFPYLTIMVPIFFFTWWLSGRWKRAKQQSQTYA